MGATLMTGEMLDRAIPDSPEAEAPRRDLRFLRRRLQDQVEKRPVRFEVRSSVSTPVTSASPRKA